MGKTELVLFYALIIIVVLLACCVDVFAHGDGYCIKLGSTYLTISHFTPDGADDPSRNPKPEYNGGHGHIKSINGERHSWGYWTQGGYAVVQNRIAYYTNNGGEERLMRAFGWVTCPGADLSDGSSNQSDGSSNQSDQSRSSTVTETLQEAKETLPDDIDLPEPVEPEPIVEWEQFQYQFYGGLNFMGFHTLPNVTTIGELWRRWRFLQHSVIYVYIDDQWLKYSGEDAENTAEIPLAPYMPLIVYLERGATLLHYSGTRLPLRDVIVLKPGTNFVAFPKIRTGFERPSSFLNDAVCAVVRTVQPTRCADGWCDNVKTISYAGDDGDYPLVDGDALLLVAVQETHIQLLIPAAPIAPRAAALTTSWGELKGFR